MIDRIRLQYLILSTLIAWTQPLVMLAFAFIWGGLALDDITGIRGFMNVGGNTDRINLWVFLPIGSLLYFLWIRGQVALVAKLRPAFSRDRFLKSKLLGNIPACSVGAVNLLTFISGMEGNVFGFLFALPLTIVVVIGMIIWLTQTVRALRGRFDRPDALADAAHRQAPS